jgi:AcrR family transcriptional regulator
VAPPCCGSVLAGRVAIVERREGTSAEAAPTHPLDKRPVTRDLKRLSERSLSPISALAPTVCNLPDQEPPVPDLRDQLLDAVVEVMATGGPGAVTTKRIASEAGCSEGSIYNHFADKQDLVACAVGERFRFPARIDELAASPGTGDVHTHLTEIAELALEFYAWVAASLGTATDAPEVMHAHAARVHAEGGGPWRSLDRLASWIDAERTLGRVHADTDAHAAATGLLGACLWQAVLVRAWGPSLAPDTPTAVHRAVTPVWMGLRPDGSG